MALAEATREAVARDPDLSVFALDGWRLAWWWETKAGRGELNDDQINFRDDCLRTGVLWGCGDPGLIRKTFVGVAPTLMGRPA